MLTGARRPTPCIAGTLLGRSPMASRTLLRWWGWAAGKPPRKEVMRKWLYAEDAPEVIPLVAATSFGAVMAVSCMAYQLIYNPSIL